MATKGNAPLYLLFSGLLYFGLNLLIMVGYAAGLINHGFLLPHHAIKLLFVLAILIAVIFPLLWQRRLRSFFGGYAVVLFEATIICTALLNVGFYWLALAAV